MLRTQPGRAEEWGRSGLVLVLSAALGVPACVARRAPRTSLPATPEQLTSRRPPLAPFRVALSGRVRLEGQKGRFSAGFGAIPPDLRLDLFHPAGGTLLTVGTSAGRLRAVWPGARECLEAEATPDILRLLVGFRIEPGELIALLSGHLYRDDSVRLESQSFGPVAIFAGEAAAPAGRDRLLVEGMDSLSGARYSAELAAERDGAALRGRRVDADGTELLVEYPGWTAGPAGSHPARIELRVPSRKLGVDLKVESWSGEGPAAAALLPPLPAGCRLLTPAELSAMGPAWQVDVSRRR